MSRIGNLSSRIFVGGLDPFVDEADLEKAFALFGDIINVMVMRDRENGRSRGFAFISFKDSGSSEQAISRMHGVEIRGRCVTVRHAEREKHLDDNKPQNRGAGSSRGRGGQSRYDRSVETSQYGGNTRRFQVSETVYVTEDDYDRPRDSYSHRRSPSPLYQESSSYRSGGGDRASYRDRSPVHDNARSRGHGSYADVDQYKTVESLSPTRELTAYIHSRGRNYSPMRDIARKIADDDLSYRRVESTNNTSYLSPERDTYSSNGRGLQYSHQQDYEKDHRQISPLASQQSRSVSSYERHSSARKYDNDQRNRSSTDYNSRRRDSPGRKAPQSSQRSEYIDKGHSYGSHNDSWNKSTRERTPPNRYGGWNKETDRSSRGERMDRSSQREDYTMGKFEKRDYSGSERNSRSQDSWSKRDDYRQQPRDRSHDQNWKKGSDDRDFDRKRDFGRSNESRSSNHEFRQNQYRDDGRGRRNAGSYRNSNTGSRGSGAMESRGSRQFSSNRRY